MMRKRKAVLWTTTAVAAAAVAHLHLLEGCRAFTPPVSLLQEPGLRRGMNRGHPGQQRTSFRQRSTPTGGVGMGAEEGGGGEGEGEDVGVAEESEAEYKRRMEIAGRQMGLRADEVSAAALRERAEKIMLDAERIKRENEEARAALDKENLVRLEAKKKKEKVDKPPPPPEDPRLAGLRATCLASYAPRLSQRIDLEEWRGKAVSELDKRGQGTRAAEEVMSGLAASTLAAFAKESTLVMGDGEAVRTKLQLLGEAGGLSKDDQRRAYKRFTTLLPRLGFQLSETDSRQGGGEGGGARKSSKAEEEATATGAAATATGVEDRFVEAERYDDSDLLRWLYTDDEENTPGQGMERLAQTLLSMVPTLVVIDELDSSPYARPVGIIKSLRRSYGPRRTGNVVGELVLKAFLSERLKTLLAARPLLAAEGGEAGGSGSGSTSSSGGKYEALQAELLGNAYWRWQKAALEREREAQQISGRGGEELTVDPSRWGLGDEPLPELAALVNLYWLELNMANPEAVKAKAGGGVGAMAKAFGGGMKGSNWGEGKEGNEEKGAADKENQTSGLQGKSADQLLQHQENGLRFKELLENRRLAVDLVRLNDTVLNDDTALKTIRCMQVGFDNYLSRKDEDIIPPMSESVLRRLRTEVLGQEDLFPGKVVLKHYRPSIAVIRGDFQVSWAKGQMQRFMELSRQAEKEMGAFALDNDEFEKELADYCRNTEGGEEREAIGVDSRAVVAIGSQKRSAETSWEAVLKRLEDTGLSKDVQLFLVKDDARKRGKAEAQLGLENDERLFTDMISNFVSDSMAIVAVSRKAQPKQWGKTPATLLLSLVGMYSVFATAIGSFALNDKFAQSIVTDMDLSVLPQVLPLVGCVAGLQAIHDSGHLAVAAVQRLPVKLPRAVPGLDIGLMPTIVDPAGYAKDRDSLTDFALAGPVAGFTASAAFLLSGLALTAGADPESLQLFPKLAPALLESSAVVGNIVNAFLPGANLGVADLVAPVALHPLAVAGVFGLWSNTLALVPYGRSDGARAVRASLGLPADVLFALPLPSLWVLYQTLFSSNEMLAANCVILFFMYPGEGVLVQNDAPVVSQWRQAAVLFSMVVLSVMLIPMGETSFLGGGGAATLLQKASQIGGL